MGFVNRKTAKLDCAHRACVVQMTSEQFTLPSFAKINWTLRVLGKRADGYHELCTVFQTIDLHDSIRFEKAVDLSLTCSSPDVPTGESNLVLRAARLLRERSGAGDGARLHLEKTIPSPGGLGGASSNAAVALIGLSHLWDIRPAPEDLMSMALELGSDVPFFLVGGTALGTGRGEVLEVLDDVEEPFMTVVTPGFGISTKEAFTGLNAENLTTPDLESTLVVCRRDARNFRVNQGDLTNDFEASIFQRAPEIQAIRAALIEKGARLAQMSGSGSSVFAVFDKEETRQATLEAIAEQNWRMFAVATLSRTRFREALNPCHSLLPISF